MNKKAYEFSNYLELINYFVSSQKSKGLRYSYQMLSTKIGVQKSYLSKVMAKAAHLNSDQVYLLAQELELSEDESHFLQLLVEKERAGLLKRKEKLEEQVLKIQKDHLKTEKALDIENLNGEDLHQYYTNTWAQIIHVSLTISKFQKNPKLIMEELNLNESVFQESIKLLEKLKMIIWNEEGLQVLQNVAHLEKSSPYFWSWRNQVTQLGQMRSQSLPPEVPYNFTVFFSTEEKVKEKVQRLFLEYLKEVEKEVSKSKASELYQMNFDIVPWLS